jgi:single-stranded-DNA-specific exonuclease
METKWHLFKPDQTVVNRLIRVLNCHPLIATILVNRNITNDHDALCFLNISLKQIRSPFLLKDIARATKRIVAAITRHERILIFGDYDVDGIAATAIFYDFFRSVGANATYYIPHRIKEGYSLQTKHIQDYISPKKIDLIITVDCGSSSHNAISAAADAGTDVIITDHHLCPDQLPDALATINPKRFDCDAGLTHLAGVGVAFFVLISIRKKLRDLGFWQGKTEPNLKSYCDVVALGTVADSVPMVYENRILTKTGLELLNTKKRTGIQALVEVSGMANQRIDTQDIAFKLAPRLNAAGRLAEGKTAVELLTTENLQKARNIARALDELNLTRQVVEKRIINDIITFLNNRPDLLLKKSLVLSDHWFNEPWHQGILGIIASKLAEKYYRPVVLIAARGELGKGSARSIPGFNIFAGLAACDAHLTKFGGHSAAAGLQLPIGNLTAFASHFEAAVQKNTEAKDFTPVLSIDAKLNFEDITDTLLDSLEVLKPFGPSNPEPLFLIKNVTVCFSKIVGQSHRRMTLKQFASGNKRINAIYFNFSESEPFRNYYEEMIVRLNWNFWNGTRTIQLVVEDTR